MKLIGHIKTHNTKSRCGNPSNTYTKPPKFSVPSFRRILVCNLTMVWVRPTTPLLATLSWFTRTTLLRRTFPNTNILRTEFSLLKSRNQKCCICKNAQIHSLFLQTHPWPFNHKHYSVFSIDHFESNSFNPDKYKSENKSKKRIKNRKSENQTLSEREITSNSLLSPGEIQTPSQVTPWWESQHAGTATLRGWFRSPSFLPVPSKGDASRHCLCFEFELEIGCFAIWMAPSLS